MNSVAPDEAKGVVLFDMGAMLEIALGAIRKLIDIKAMM
jgi:hypothetical protein